MQPIIQRTCGKAQNAPYSEFDALIDHFCCGISPSSLLSALFLPSTRTYSESDSPSLGPGVGGRSPAAYLLSFVCLNSAERGLVGCSLNVSPSGTRCLGLDLPDDFPGGLPLAACFNLSSVAFSLASRASSSEVCVDTAFFLQMVRAGACYTKGLHTSLRQLHPSLRYCYLS